GSVGDPGQAPALVGDCDLVANFALAIGRPREARERSGRVIAQAALAPPAGAKIVYFSTLSVYRRFRPANAPGGRTAYGDEKLRCERDARRVGRRLRKKTYVLRLGHVVGELQAIRQQLRQLLAAGPVVVPRGGALPSNVVHTLTVVDALSRIAAGAPAGVY